MLVVRSLAFNLFLYVFTAICSIIAMLVAIFWPSQLAEVARRWSQAWLYAYQLICGVSLSVRGVEHMPQDPCIIAMKHQSTWDTFALFAIFNRPVFVLKSELMWVPVFGWVLKRLGCIAVKRGTGKFAVESMIQGARTAASRGNHIVVFPEGTRSTVGVPAEYKSGVSHLYSALGVACVPVGLNSGLFWPRRSILRPPGRIVVEILPPIPPGVPRREMFERLVNDIETTSQRLKSETLQRDFGK